MTALEDSIGGDDGRIVCEDGIRWWYEIAFQHRDIREQTDKERQTGGDTWLHVDRDAYVHT